MGTSLKMKSPHRDKWFEWNTGSSLLEVETPHRQRRLSYWRFTEGPRQAEVIFKQDGNDCEGTSGKCEIMGCEEVGHLLATFSTFYRISLCDLSVWIIVMCTTINS